ncbi:MAG: hypothetical protein JEZ08_09635 [Clostridiales bacterium]|nr:hypothetical protein [Clostridiales bacterium]
MNKPVEIKTKYTDKNECMTSCLDYHGKTYLAWLFNKDISGIVDGGGHFELSSRSSAAAMQVFSGEIVEKKDAIYMIGEIRAKPFVKKLLWVFTVLMLLSAPIYIIEWGNVCELVFFTLLLINYCFMYRSDMLYKRISNKVCIKKTSL